MRYVRLAWSFIRISSLREIQYRANFFLQFLHSLIGLMPGLAGRPGLDLDRRDAQRPGQDDRVARLDHARLGHPERRLPAPDGDGVGLRGKRIYARDGVSGLVRLANEDARINDVLSRLVATDRDAAGAGDAPSGGA